MGHHGISAKSVLNVDISGYSGVGFAGTYLKMLYDDWLNGGRLDNLLDAIPTTAMRGTDNALLAANYVTERGTNNAALASVCTEARLAHLTQDIPDMVGTNNAALASVCTEARLARLNADMSSRSSHSAANVRAQVCLTGDGAASIGKILFDLNNWWKDGGRLDNLLDAIPTTAMRGTDSAALASVCTEARLAHLTQDIPTMVGTNNAATETKQDIIDGVVDDIKTQTEKIPKAIALGGSGADGAKTVASSENITPDTIYEYTTLTVNSGQTLGLSAAGRMLLRCSGKVTINGTISINGKGTAGGAGGSGGVGSAGATPETNTGLISGAGGGGGGAGNAGGAGSAGGAGAGSGDTGCGAGGAGGAGGAISSNGSPGSVGIAFTLIPTGLDYLLNKYGNLIFNVGPGGGGGGGSWAGGGGGAGGGCILIYAPEVEIASGGAIAANGTNGGNGTVYGTAGDGGGGGGAGGCILIITKKFTNSGTITAAGGSGGSGGNSTTDGGDGGAGGAGNVKVILI